MLKTAVSLVVQTVRQWWSDDVFLYAAAIAFYTIFSLAPILLISVSIAGLVFSEQDVEEQIIKEMEGLTGLDGGQAIRQVLQSTTLLNGSPLALIIGIVTVLVGSTAVFANLQASLNHVWQVRARSDRNALKTVIGVRMRSFGIVLSVGFLLLVSMVLSALLNGLQAMMADHVQGFSWLWRFANTFITFFIIILLFALIYRYLPDVRISWPDVMIGATITAVLFSAGKSVIGFYLGKVAIGSTYGAAGSFVVLLIWIYYSTLIFFFGAEFTQVYARRFGKRIRPETYAEPVDEDRKTDGRTTRESGRPEKRRSRQMNESIDNWEDCPECRGTGKISIQNCGTCRGKGQIIVHSHVHRHGEHVHDHPHPHDEPHHPDDEGEHSHPH